MSRRTIRSTVLPTVFFVAPAGATAAPGRWISEHDAVAETSSASY